MVHVYYLFFKQPLGSLRPPPPNEVDLYQLVKEEDARRGGSGLVEDVPDVGLALTEPHGQQFGALHGNEVGLAFVGDGLCQQHLCRGGQCGRLRRCVFLLRTFSPDRL